MFVYKRKVQYHETDRMGISHHSNYVKWTEEARMAFLDYVGAPYENLEEEGIISPVVGLEVEYKKTSTFADRLEISVFVEKYNGVRLNLRYAIRKTGSDEVITTARTRHCFLKNGAVCSLKSCVPQVHAVLKRAAEEYAADSV